MVGCLFLPHAKTDFSACRHSQKELDAIWKRDGPGRALGAADSSVVSHERFAPLFHRQSIPMHWFRGFSWGLCSFFFPFFPFSGFVNGGRGVGGGGNKRGIVIWCLGCLFSDALTGPVLLCFLPSLFARLLSLFLSTFLCLGNFRSSLA
ncbi:hypothetical protein B0T22DRAFT_117215 [Podospora appendiculata]|uniref:Transmembrane protein n=1 Tax=Podospora appendiculata TaxID=314037 RepID=A0AAE1CJ09_9PEZI|nr:hypothetical protein B0T22DRAFT_117215 [Podospora appendiculata]